ncbi:MAG: SusF/SusE family outer membrane protein [Bacteroidales bacterium]|nr:SusF/SusE family outer membrane protein [Bacteroidales bacterium]
MKKLLNILALVGICFSMASCSDEKDVIIIEGNLPIKTANLYMVGNATPAGWNIDEPVALTRSEEDPLIFVYNGPLYRGEIKCPLTTGNWNCNYVMPITHYIEINKNGCAERNFDLVNGGQPDKKWNVTEAGVYTLIFDLRNWTLDVTYESKLPLEIATLYIVGNATPAGWNIEQPVELTMTEPSVFVYDGPLYAGEMKCPVTTGNWNVDYIMPLTDQIEINSNGCAEKEFDFVKGGSPDKKWNITESGNYKITFDLRNWSIDVVFKSAL